MYNELVVLYMDTIRNRRYPLLLGTLAIMQRFSYMSNIPIQYMLLFKELLPFEISTLSSDIIVNKTCMCCAFSKHISTAPRNSIILQQVPVCRETNPNLLMISIRSKRSHLKFSLEISVIDRNYY